MAPSAIADDPPSYKSLEPISQASPITDGPPSYKILRSVPQDSTCYASVLHGIRDLRYVSNSGPLGVCDYIPK